MATLSESMLRSNSMGRKMSYSMLIFNSMGTLGRNVSEMLTCSRFQKSKLVFISSYVMGPAALYDQESIQRHILSMNAMIYKRVCFSRCRPMSSSSMICIFQNL
jgi:hypothetical protein